MERTDTIVGGHGGDFARGLGEEGARQWQKLMEDGITQASDVPPLRFVLAQRGVVCEAFVKATYRHPSTSAEDIHNDIIERMDRAGWKHSE